MPRSSSFLPALSLSLLRQRCKEAETKKAQVQAVLRELDVGLAQVRAASLLPHPAIAIVRPPL